MAFRKVAKVKHVASGEMIGVDFGNSRVAIANIDGEYYAFEAECTHSAGWLYEGMIEGFNVQCPVHGAEFDVRTGEVKEAPATQGLRIFRVRAEGDDLELEEPD